MGQLIDTTVLFDKVSEYTDVPVHQLTNHLSLVEVIALLVKEIEEMEEHQDELYAEIAKSKGVINEEEKDKPTWMKKDGK